MDSWGFRSVGCLEIQYIVWYIAQFYEAKWETARSREISGRAPACRRPREDRSWRATRADASAPAPAPARARILLLFAEPRVAKKLDCGELRTMQFAFRRIQRRDHRRWNDGPRTGFSQERPRKKENRKLRWSAAWSFEWDSRPKAEATWSFSRPEDEFFCQLIFENTSRTVGSEKRTSLSFFFIIVF